MPTYVGPLQDDEQVVNETLGVILKYQDDVEQVRGGVATELTQRAQNYTEQGYARATR